MAHRRDPDWNDGANGGGTPPCFGLALQECLDLAAHWIASEGWVPAAHAAASFDSLAAHGVIPPDLAAFLRGAASLRNRIAHGYGDVDLGRLQAEARAGIPSIRRFLDVAARAAGM